MCDLYDVVVIGGVFREIGADPRAPRLDVAGSGLTASVIAARLGAHTALVASVGDEDAEVANEVLRTARVDNRWLKTTPGASGTFLFPRVADGAHPWPLFRPAESPPCTDLDHGLPRAHTYLLFGMPELDPVAEGWMSEVPLDSTIIWDRQGWLSRARDWRVALQVRSERRIYVANQDEAMADFNVDTPDELADQLPPDGFNISVVKRGSDGCFFRRRRGETVDGATLMGFPVDTESTIGSGDVFAGALAARVSQSVALRESLMVANSVAAAFLIEGRDVSAERLLRTAQSLIDQRVGSSAPGRTRE